MKIFIAGATGVLGRRVTQGLIYSGHQVVALSRSYDNDYVITKLGANPRRSDLFDSHSLISGSSGCDAILHLATSVPFKVPGLPEDWELNDRIRTEGTSNLLQAATYNKCKLYIQQSITAIYGNHGDNWVDENSAVSPVLPQPVESSVEMENLVISAVKNYNLPAIILRFGTFYSYDSKLTASIFENIKERKLSIIRNGNVYWNLINVDDAADAVIKAVDNAEYNTNKIFNICYNEPALYKDVIKYIAFRLNSDLPGSISKEKAKQFLGAGIVDYMLTSYKCSNKRARKELGLNHHHPEYTEGYSYEIKKWLIDRSKRQMTIDNY